MSHVAITIVAWNSMKYLPEALASIEAQTFRDFSLIIVDNASDDGVAEYVRANHPRAMIIRNTQNLGFARGHNQAIAYARTHLAQDGGGELFVLVTNPDIILQPDYLETIVGAVERRQEVGSAVGKLLKVRETNDGELREGERTTIVDTTGLRVHRSRRITERGAGEQDDGGFDRTGEVFGVSGALALYRMQALTDVAIDGEYFDEDFFVYKEDVDLAWRLRLRGWSALYVPRARAYHYRAAYGAERAGAIEVMRARRGRSKVVNFYSYRNHLLLLAKNEHVVNALVDMPRIAWYELRKFAYILFLEPSTLRAVPSYFALLPRTLKKRGAIMRGARVKPAEVRKWFS